MKRSKALVGYPDFPIGLKVKISYLPAAGLNVNGTLCSAVNCTVVSDAPTRRKGRNRYKQPHTQRIHSEGLVVMAAACPQSVPP